jgi:PhnB protein
MAKKKAASVRKTAPAKTKAGKKKVKPIPKGYRTVTPYLSVKGAKDAIRFYKKVFGATERMRFPMPGGLVGHCELKIGDTIVMLADEFPDMGFSAPGTVGGTPVILHMYVENVDRLFAKAIKNGATAQRPVQDQFYGDRSGTFQDPFGHLWSVSSQIEKLSTKEMMRRMKAMGGPPAS